MASLWDDVRMIARLASAMALGALLIGAPAAAEPFAYIAVGEPINALRVIDTETLLDARAPIALPRAPVGTVAVSPNGRRVYLGTSGRTLAVDTVTGEVADNPNLPAYLQGVGVVSSDGRRMHFGPFTIDLSSGARWGVPPPTGFIIPGGATHVAAGPDGRVYYLWCSDAPYGCDLRARDEFSDVVAWTVGVFNGANFGGPTGMVLSPDEKFVYVSYSTARSPYAGLAAHSTATHEVVWTLSLGTYGLYPGRVAISPDGRRLYALNGKSPSVTVVDVEQRAIVKSIPLGVGDIHPEDKLTPYGGIAVTPDNRAVWITNGMHGSVSVIDTATLEIVATLGGFGNAVSYANFIGPLAKDAAIEYYNANLDHYFVTAHPAEIYAIDAGAVAGWKRTGQQFTAHPPRSAGAKPVCRIYIPPALGDSHFYSASATECEEVIAKFPALILESRDLFYVDLPDPVTGTCPPGSTPVFRLWNQRADSNHRYTTSGAVRDAMVAKGYQPEGYGLGAIAMCAP